MFDRPYTWNEAAVPQENSTMSSSGAGIWLKGLVLLTVLSCLPQQNVAAQSEMRPADAINSTDSNFITSQRFQPPKFNSSNALDTLHAIKFRQDLLSIINAISLPGWNASDTRVLWLRSGTNPGESPTSHSPIALSDPQQQSIVEEFGCASIVKRSYQRGQQQVIVEVYTFKTPQGAYAAYSLLRSGASTVVTRGDASSEDDQNISFCKANYFISIHGTSPDAEESKEIASKIADSLDASIISRGQLPSVLSRLPVLDRVRGSEKVVMGPTSAHKFFPAPYLGYLAMDKAKEAATADYQFQQPYRERMKLLIVDYGKDEVALKAYYDYVNSLRSTHEEEWGASSPNATSIFRISGNYLLCQLRGQQVVLVIGARKRLSSIILAKNVL